MTVIDFKRAKEKSEEKKSINQSSIQSLSLEDVFNILQQIALSSRENLFEMLIKSDDSFLVELWDIDGFRGFIIDVINTLKVKSSEIQSWIYNQITNDSKGLHNHEQIDVNLEKIFSQKVYEIAVNGVDIENKTDGCFAFAASLYWVAHGFYDGEEPLLLNHFIHGIISRNYDFEKHHIEITRNSLSLCSTWFSKKMIKEEGHFAVLMMDGNIIEFSHMNSISILKKNQPYYGQLAAHLELPEKYVINSDLLKKYKKRLIKNNLMVIDLKNVLHRKSSNGERWIDGEIKEPSYRIGGPYVSINLKHVLRLEEHENTAYRLFINVNDLDLPDQPFPDDEESVTILLKEAVMFFDMGWSLNEWGLKNGKY